MEKKVFPSIQIIEQASPSREITCPLKRNFHYVNIEITVNKESWPPAIRFSIKKISKMDEECKKLNRDKDMTLENIMQRI